MKKYDPDVNVFWTMVKRAYPDARFVKWFSDGELHFYPTGRKERAEKDLGTCYRDDKGHMAISIGDEWK